MIKINFFCKIYDALCADIFKYIFHWRSTKIPATDSSKINTFNDKVLNSQRGQTSRTYSHWGQRTYASDFNFMTSRELTSGFDFWSRGHLRIAVMHRPIKFGADIFIHSAVIDVFSEIQDGGSCHLGYSGCEFGHYGVLTVWYLSSVPNLV